jgi:hypothetical protein
MLQSRCKSGATSLGKLRHNQVRFSLRCRGHHNEQIAFRKAFWFLLRESARRGGCFALAGARPGAGGNMDGNYFRWAG